MFEMGNIITIKMQPSTVVPVNNYPEASTPEIDEDDIGCIEKIGCLMCA